MAQTLFRPITPFFSTLLPCILMFFIGKKLEKVRILGLTGGIATGKSTLVRLIKANLNTEVIDCDEISRRLSDKGRPGYKFILGMLGDRAEEFLHPLTREIEREKFSDFIFRNPELRKQLTKGLGKFIFAEILKTVISNIFHNRHLMVIDAPVLFETKILVHVCYPIVVVGCPEVIQVQRLTARNGYTEEEAKLRIQSQMPLAAKKKRAQIYIENTESEEKLLSLFISKTLKYIDKKKVDSMHP